MIKNDQDPFTFGVMCDGNALKYWQKKCIDRLSGLEKIKLSLIIKDERENSVKERILNARPSQLLFQVYYKWLITNKALKQVKIDDKFEGIKKVSVVPKEEESYSEYFPKDKIKEIESYDLDFIVRFGFGILRGDILNAATYGIWSFHHDDERMYRGGPPCFWEVYYGDEYNEYILQRLTDRLDGGVILNRGKVKTEKASYSKNIEKVFMESTNLIVETCERLKSEEELNGSKSPSEAPIYSYPRNLTFIRFIGTLLWRKIMRKYANWNSKNC